MTRWDNPYWRARHFTHLETRLRMLLIFGALVVGAYLILRLILGVAP